MLAGMSQPQARGAACVRIPTPACQLSDIHCFAVHCKGIAPTSAHHNADQPNNVNEPCLLIYVARLLYTVSSAVCGSPTANVLFPIPSRQLGRMPQRSPGLLRSHRSDFAGVYRQPPHPRPNCDWHSAGRSPKRSPTQPWTAKDTFTQNLSTSACGTFFTPFVIILDRRASQLQRERDANSSFGASAGIFDRDSPPRVWRPTSIKNQTRWTVLEICAPYFCPGSAGIPCHGTEDRLATHECAEALRDLQCGGGDEAAIAPRS